MKKGNKTKSEKVLNKSIKTLQKISRKPTKELIQLSIILFSTIFKQYIIVKKRRKKKKTRTVLIFTTNQNERFSLSIKRILFSAKRNYSNGLSYKLTQEFFLITQIKKNKFIKTKKNSEKQIFNKKYLLKHYK